MTSDWFSKITPQWTLFLDRDGVINRRLDDDYVKNIDEFDFLPRVLEAMELLAYRFGVIVVVTNQQGIGKGLMTEEDLVLIHHYMVVEVSNQGGRIDGIFHCPELAENDPPCRKPNTGMAFEARERFPEIDFSRAVMVGDSESDMEFGERMGMHCIKIGESSSSHITMPSLFHFATGISSQ